MPELLESSSIVLPVDQHQSFLPAKQASLNWKQWAKAGLIFATTTGAFTLISSWLKHASSKTDLDIPPKNNVIKSVTEKIRSIRSNEPPILVNNSLTITSGENKILANTELSAIDLDTDDNSLVFTVSEVQHGEFSYINGTTTLTWIQGQLIAGNISFSHDGSLVAPTYLIRVSDGIEMTDCSRPYIQFSADFSENTPITDEFQVNTYTPYDQMTPSVASMSDGRFVVIWSINGQSSIYGQLFNVDANKSGTEFQTTGWRPKVASFSDGKFVIISYYDEEIYGQLYNSDGNKNGPEFQANTFTESQQEDPTVASFSDGRFIVAWKSDSQDDVSDWGIFAQLFANNGSKIDSEFQVNTYTANAQAIPSVISFIDDGFIVTWESAGQDGSDMGVYGQLFNSNGSKNGPEFQVNSYTDGNQWYSSTTSCL